MQRLHAYQPDALQKIDQQHRGRGKLRCAESIGMKKSPQHMAQQSGTECFTMFGTMMDNKPLSPSTAEPDPPLAADDTKPAASSSAPSSAPTTGARRKSPLRDFFVGPDGIYAAPRWLIYLAIAFVVFQMEVWLLASLRPHLSDLLWRMMIELSMMLAAILPGFAMARIEARPFGDFGLPARRSFGRNFWVGTLWGIVSLSVLILALRVAGAFKFGRLELHGARILKFA